MNLAMLYAVMKLGDESEPNTYLCRDDGGLYWSDRARKHNSEMVSINADRFTLLAYWYWDTFEGETSFGKWSQRHKISVSSEIWDVIVEISVCVDSVVFCGCQVHPHPEVKTLNLRVYEPTYNQMITDKKMLAWINTMQLGELK